MYWDYSFYGEWTKEQVRKVVLTSLEIEQKNVVNLDVEHAGAANIREIIRWCKEMGYEAIEIPHSECVKVEKLK